MTEINGYPYPVSSNMASWEIPQNRDVRGENDLLMMDLSLPCLITGRYAIFWGKTRPPMMGISTVHPSGIWDLPGSSVKSCFGVPNLTHVFVTGPIFENLPITNVG